MDWPGTYFEGDHPSLRERLEAHFARVSHSFGRHGFAGTLVLGGGYGRGEGGVMPVGDGVGFSNDLDYFLFDDTPDSPALTEWCRQTEREESQVLGIDVEIKCLRKDSMGDVSSSMMFSDLVAGHVVVAGDAAFLQSMHASLDFSRLAPEEATRLLWNRGSGVFFSKCRLERRAEMSYVIRNHAKVKLALGDAWLCLSGSYVPWCRQRHQRLLECELPAGLERLAAWHAEGVEFKFHPFQHGPGWEELDEESSALSAAWGKMFLLVESRRLDRAIGSLDSYVRLPRILPGNPLRHLMLAARDRLKRGGCVHPVTDYPRAGLMRALPCLLDLTSGGPGQAASFLPLPNGDSAKRSAWEPVYARWWNFYS